MVRLFIEDKELEIDNSVQVAITKQFEELSNPTTIINDWSKTVSIPFTTKNNEIFGYIFNPDRLVTYQATTNYISGTPSAIKKWNGSDYVNDTLDNGNIVCNIPVQYLQVGFQYINSWTYSSVKNYRCTNDFHTFDFTYSPVDNYRFEFSFRDMASEAPNNEVYYVQWILTGLTEGEVYTVSFKHIKSGDNYIITDFSLSPKQSMTGINFNPLLKLDFRLEWDSSVIMVGYAKMNEVKQVNGKGTYELTLFGELGKVFQEMKKITFDTSTEDTDYLIDGSDYVDEYINKELVYNSWRSEGQQYPVLKKKTDNGYLVTDIIGFAPNNSFSDGFKYDTFQPSNSTSKTFKDVLGTGFTEATGVEPETAIPDGLLPREIGEYRSYLQLPYIYWDKLFQIFQQKAEKLTGYNFELDDDWFNNSNPYYYFLVYMLKAFDLKDGTMRDDANYYTANPYGSMGWQKTSSINTMTTHRTVNLCTYTNGTNVETIPMLNSSVTFYDGEWYTLSDTNINPIFKIKTLWHIWDGDCSSSSSHLNNNNALVVKVNAVGENGYTETIKFLIKNTGCTLTEEGANVIIFEGSTMAGDRDLFNIDANFLVTRSKFGDSIRFRFEGYWKNSNWSLSSNGDLVYLEPYNVNNPNFTYVTLLDGVHRSFGHFTLNDLWNKDYNVFEEILRYCKTFRLSIYIDEINKKVIFKPYYKYFENYKIVDWTDKVDKTRDFVIKPVTFDSKYVLFNYEDSETQEGKNYKEKYGVNYGDYRLVTQYNFNNETTELFENATPSITNTDNVLSWTNIYDNHKILYSFPAEIYVYNKDEDKKQVDIFGAYYFHNGLADFSTEASLSLRSVNLTDDTAFQQANNNYFYTQLGGKKIYVTTYPKLDIVRGDNLCVYNIPKENYTYLNNYASKNSIYTNLWQNYIGERYNIQNKMVTCYIMLKPSDYSQFAWNKIVKIDNQIYMVNKIYDYDVTSTIPTKVDLVTIQDIEGYISNNYKYDYIIATPNEIDIPYDYYKKITVRANKNWEIRNNDWTDYLTAIPQSGTSGTTEVIIGSIDENNGYTLTFDLLSNDGTEVLVSDYVRCNVSGNSTIHVNQWYNEISVGGSCDVLITSPYTKWEIIKIDNKSNINCTISPMSGNSGLNLPVTFTSISGTGVVDVYVGNEAGDIVSFRVNVTA